MNHHTGSLAFLLPTSSSRLNRTIPTPRHPHPVATRDPSICSHRRPPTPPRSSPPVLYLFNLQQMSIPGRMRSVVAARATVGCRRVGGEVEKKRHAAAQVHHRSYNQQRIEPRQPARATSTLNYNRCISSSASSSMQAVPIVYVPCQDLIQSNQRGRPWAIQRS